MEEKEEIPNHVIERYKITFKESLQPNIVRTKNITSDGVNTLIEKNKLIWSKSNYDKSFTHIEGVVLWGSSEVIVYFKKIDNENTYKIYILTNNLEKINMLLVGLNKFFTIDKI